MDLQIFYFDFVYEPSRSIHFFTIWIAVHACRQENHLSPGRACVTCPPRPRQPRDETRKGLTVVAGWRGSSGHVWLNISANGSNWNHNSSRTYATVTEQAEGREGRRTSRCDHRPLRKSTNRRQERYLLPRHRRLEPDFPEGVGLKRRAHESRAMDSNAEEERTRH